MMMMLRVPGQAVVRRAPAAPRRTCSARSGHPFSTPAVGSSRRSFTAQASADGQSGTDIEAKMAELRKRLESADPETKKKMEAQMGAMGDMLKRPEVQAQMKAVQSAMENEEVRRKMEEIRQDPELKPMFEDMQKNGPMAMMKYMGNPSLMKKFAAIGEMVTPGGLAAMQNSGAAAMAASAPAPPPAPAITTLQLAARYGDAAALDDFIRVGADINAADDAGRTALHMACGFGAGPTGDVILSKLIAVPGRDLNAKDSRGNAPLHYAAGYGKGGYVEALLAAGATPAPRNTAGQTPGDLIRAEPRNPLASQPDILAKLPS